MTQDVKDRETVLAEASRAIRAALQAQRQQLAARMRSDPTAGGDFPRSVTMRLFMQRPAQSAAWLLALLRSRRLVGGSLFAMLVLGLALRALRLALLAPEGAPESAAARAIAAPTRAQNALGAAPRPR